MAITTRDQLINAMGNNFSQIVSERSSVTNQTSGRRCSMFRAGGVPGAGTIPTTAALCTSATTGALPFTNQTAPAKSYMAALQVSISNPTSTVEIHDRIAHIGGFSLTSTTAQTVTGMNLATLSAPAARVGAADYSEVRWWLEVYADGGATASNATITATFDDDSSATLAVQAVGGTVRAGNCFPLRPLIQAAQNGKKIKGITSVILSASTTAAGNFGFTATRTIASIGCLTSSFSTERDWAQLGLATVPNDSCLSPMVLNATTSTGTLRMVGKIAHG